VFLFTLTLSSLLLAGNWVRMEFESRNIQKQINATNQAIEDPGVQKLFSWVEGANKTLSTIDKLQQFDRDVSPYLAMFSRNIPNGIVLDKLIMNDVGSWTIGGKTNSSQSLLIFKESLKSELNVVSVEIPLSALGDTKDNAFEMNVKLKDIAPENENK